MHGFSASITEILTNSKASVSSGDAREECKRQPQAGADGSHSKELCQQTAEAARRASDALSGAQSAMGRNSDELRQELEAQEDALRFTTAARGACAQTK